MIKILGPQAYCNPEVMASTQMWNHLNRAFAESGFLHVVYTPMPTRGVSDEVREEYKKKKHEILYDGKLEIHRFSLFKEGKNPFSRAMRYFLLCAISLQKSLYGKEAKDCNVIYAVSTPPIIGAMSAFVKRRRKIPFVYVLQDIFPDSLVGTGLAKKDSFLWKIGRKIEDYTYKYADKIIVIGEDFKRNIMAKGVPEEKIEVVYNWVDENAVMPIAKVDNPLYEELGISRDKFHVVYAGNLGNAQNIDVIVDSAKEMVCDKDVEFLIFGTGGLKEQFVEKVKNYGIDNVRFFPLQPMERVSQVYGLGDVCVVSCKPGLGGAAMPSKMLSIMSAGRAVVASFDEGELTYILKKLNCGIYAPAGDVQAFVKMVRTMTSDRKSCEEMGKNARKQILNYFTRAYGTSKYIDIIRKLVDND